MEGVRLRLPLFVEEVFEMGKLPYYKLENYYYNKELQKAAYAFKWKSNDIPIPRNIELILTLNGSIGWSPKHKKWFKGSFTGVVDDLNEFKEYVAISLATEPETYTLKNNEEIVVCGNNSMYMTDEPLYRWYAGFSQDIDVSMYYQLINSRNIPAIQAQNDTQAKAIKKAFEEIQAGIPVIITADIFDDGIQPLDVTDKSLIEKMQYITSFFGETEKRFFNLRGIDVNTLDKRAQVTESELDQFSDATSNNYIAMYRARLDFCEKMKELFGINIEVIPNPIYSEEPKAEEFDSVEAQEEAKEPEDLSTESGEEVDKEEKDENLQD